MRKAALAGAVASVGALALGSVTKALPESSASSAGYNYTDLYVQCRVLIGRCTPSTSCVALCVSSGNLRAYEGIFAQNTNPNAAAVYANATGEYGNGVEGYGIGDHGVGVYGQTSNGTAVLAYSCAFCAVGVYSVVGHPSSNAIIAQGAAQQKANLVEIQNSCNNALSVINAIGWLGIGTNNPANAICVVSDCGNAVNACSNASCRAGVYGHGVGAGVAGRTDSPGGAGVHGRAGNPCSNALIAQGGPGQKANLVEIQNNCKSILSVVNPCGWFGIGTSAPKTGLQVNSSISAKVVAPTGAYVMGSTDFAVLTKGNVTLPSASTSVGMLVFIKNIGKSSITVIAAGSDKIEGKTTETLSKQYKSLTLMSDGNSPGNWYVVSNAA